jgi:hypothetical protein
MKTVGLALAVALMLPFAGSQAQQADEQGARAAVEHYLKGHATGDPKEFAAAFHEQARLFWVDPQGKLMTRTSADYIAAASGKPAADEAKRNRRIVSIDVTRTAGVAKVELDYPSVHFIDYLALLKIDGEWKVINKIFTAERRSTN